MGDDKSKVSSGRNKRKFVAFLAVTPVVVAVDQVSKLWVRTFLEQGQTLPLTERLSLTHVVNTGSAFGLLANQTFLLTIIGIASLLIFLLFLRYLAQVSTLSMTSVGLIWGGALGNLVDRLRLGHVTDFIDFRLWGTFHWPAFNVADAAITVGVFLLIYSFGRSGIFGKRYECGSRPGSRDIAL